MKLLWLHQDIFPIIKENPNRWDDYYDLWDHMFFGTPEELKDQIENGNSKFEEWVPFFTMGDL